MSAASGTRERGRRWSDGPLAVLAVAATYVYFLLFAQYGFLRLARQNLALGPEADLRPALAAMGVCGLLASVAAGRLLARRPARTLLRAGFALAAAVAVACTGLHTESLLVIAGGAIGTAIALITVPLATWLPDLLRPSGEAGRERGAVPLGLGIGIGTGTAYLACNLPPVFEGAPALQAGVSAGAALLGLGAAWALPAGASEPAGAATGAAIQAAAGHHPSSLALGERDARGLGFAAIVASFLALVWLDSAAFAVIQETAPLKSPTWGSPAHALSMGGVHLLAALAAGWAIDRGVFRGLLLGAFGLFAVAFTTLVSGAGPVAFAGPIYAIGISFYSVALVAFPGLVPETPGATRSAPRTVPRRWRAATLYGVAGWLGSALGVGMAQNLHTIPAPFLWSAGALLASAWLLPRALARALARELAPAFLPSIGAAGLALAATLVGGASAPARGDLAADPVARGRSVYLAEGCINCHSQYVRPERTATASADVERWGPHRPLERDPGPVLIGNRRQGPDLLNVGTRRSPTWQRLHLIEPRSLSPGSRMPSYAHLFAGDGRRGADLVAYLDSLGAEQRAERYHQVQAFDLSAALPDGDAARGRETFGRYCSACHGTNAAGDGRFASELDGEALDLHKPGFRLVTWGPDGSVDNAAGTAAGHGALEQGLTRLIRWGLPGSDMPGHETLPVERIADLVAYVLSLQSLQPKQDAAAAPGVSPAGAP